MRRLKAPFSFIWHCCALAVLGVLTVGLGYAQSQSGASGLRVTVTDMQQQAIPGAVCSLHPSSHIAEIAATVTTNEQGIAVFPATYGTFTLSVESAGFETLKRN